MRRYKYNEDVSIKQLQSYIDETYGQHYVSKDIQVVDVWESLGTLETTSRDTAIKYLARYGKKGGKNKKDLLKAMHYIILMMYADTAEYQKALINGQKLEPLKPLTESDLLSLRINSDQIRDAYEQTMAFDNYPKGYPGGLVGQ
jgi:hypothetical protein